MEILWGYLKNYWGLILFTLFLATINQCFSMLDPYIFRLIIDGYVTVPHDTLSVEEFFKGAGMLILAAVGVAMVSRIAKAFQDYYVNVITQKLGAKIYTDGLRHSLLLPYQDFEDQRSGETLGVLIKVRSDVEKLVATVINVLFGTVVGIVFVTFYAISVYWVIAPIFFSTIPVLGFLSWTLSKRIKKVQRKIVDETTALAGSTTESLRNIELVKSLGLSGQEETRLNTTTDKILKLELKKVKYLRSLNFIQGTIVNFLRNVILIIMLFLIFDGKITVGEFFSLFIYSFFIFGPMQQLGTIINTFRETEASLENFKAIMEKDIEPRPVKPVKLNRVEHLEFQDVSFQHQSASTPALIDINFRVKHGDTVAFVGPSGSGKTTLVKLLVGLYNPGSGSVLYNAHAENTIDLEELREQIGFVTQDTQLFSGTIRENLLFVKPTATDEDCLLVLEMAACQSLLDRAAEGLDTVIGEGGIKVSGGEKQRLSIARALLRKPTLLVFDEATSALDSITEKEITETIRTISSNRRHITILIAHRLSTIMHADTIFVLEKGKIVESGKHEKLLDRKGLYYAMWRQQIGERK